MDDKSLNICFTLQLVHFTRSYNTTPSVLVSANHSTAASGNSAPVHNGITAWIEVKLVLELYIEYSSNFFQCFL